MVFRKDIKKYALISVFDKKNLKYLCQNLNKQNYLFISTGSTSKKIKSLGFQCLEVSKITKFKEILGGRVKTLNPKIFGSLLFKRDDNIHQKEFKKLNVPKIDLVIVNLYPFSKFIKNKDQSKIIEMIDVGGPSLIRAAGKNYEYVTTITSIKDYVNLIKNLNKNSGNTDIIFRKKMAAKVFKITAQYDKGICEWFNKKNITNKKIDLRYGENPFQKSHIISDKHKSIFNLKISGKDISYNNIIDVDSGFKCLSEFNEPTCVIIKHNNPCGVASSKNIEKAFEKAFESDSKSAFGGIVLLNRKITKKLALKISKRFFELIAATDFEEDSLEILKKKKKLILIKTDKVRLNSMEVRSTVFGEIYQNIDTNKINRKFLKLVASNKVSDSKIDDLVFSSKVAKHVKSNAIVISANKQTLGMGIGQTNRVDSLKIALSKYTRNFKYKKNFVCVSDGFFPFTDSLEILNKYSCKAVGQPSGSINDHKNIEYAKKNKLPLYFLKERLFKH